MERYNKNNYRDGAADSLDDEEEDELFNKIMGKIKSGETVWLPRVEDPDTIDLFKNKKYQGCVRLEDAHNNLYQAYKADPDHLDVELACVTPRPLVFHAAAKLILDLIPLE